MVKLKFNITKPDLKLYLTCLAITVLTYSMIFTLPVSIIHAQNTNVWNIQRNTDNNDLDFYLTTNGVSGSSLRLNSNGNARIRSLYDLDDTTNTYYLNPQGASVLNTLNLSSLNVSGALTTGSLAPSTLSLTTNGAIVTFPEISTNTSYAGITAANGFMSDGVPWYGGFGREPGSWTPPYPDYVISNHTGLRLAAHGGYGGVAIYDQYNWSTGTWTSTGTEIARFRADPAGGTVINSILNLSGYTPLNFTYGGYNTPGGTFRLTPNVHINSPTNYGVIINWDNGSTGDASVGQFVVGNGAGGSLFTVSRNAVVSANYYHAWQNDSWFPYVNGWNYFRGNTMAFTGVWYDENNTGYYLDPSGHTKLYRVGLGNAGTPTADLHIKQTDNSQGGSGGIKLERVDNGGFARIFEGGDQQLYLFTNSNAQYCVVTIGNSISCPSDRRLKENIAPIIDSLSIINKLKPTKFDVINGGKDQAGFIAQEVLDILPGAISQDINGYYIMNMDYIVPYTVKGIQELNQKVETQQNEIEQLKNEMELLKKKIDDMENK